jgi:hypothetical protein
MMLSREHYRRLLQLAVVACLIQQLPAQCMDAASDCLAAAIAGECTTNGAYMSVNCKASCGLCGIALGSASEDAVGEEMPLDRIPLMFSGQQIASGDVPEFGAPAEDIAEFVGGDIRVVLKQPTLAEQCCWGANAMLRYETSGTLSVPEDGIVVFRFAGEEADVMPFARGEFQAFVKAPGRYPLQVAIESHDRSQRLALADAELLVTAEGPMHANVSDDVSDPQDGQAMRVLRHALRPDANSSCHVHCVSTDELDELRAEAAHQLYQRDLQTQTSSSYSSSSATSHSAGEAAAAATGRTVGATRTFVLQIGA